MACLVPSLARLLESRDHKSVTRALTLICMLLVVLAGAFACGGDDANEGTPTPLPAGTWGGAGVRLDVATASTIVEFDCAHGTIDSITPAPDGTFSTQGIYIREHGGPVHEGETPESYAATYAGNVDGDTMILRVGVPGIPVAIEYQLTRGTPGELRKCL